MATFFERLFRAGVVVAAAALVFACEKKEGKTPTDFTHPDYSRTDSLVIKAIYSVDRRDFYERDPQRSAFLVDSLKQVIGRMEADGDLSTAAADVWLGRLYQYAIRPNDAEDCYRHAMTYDSPADRRLWYYNYAGAQLAYLMYMRHNYDGFLRVAVPLLASMDSLGNGLYDQKIDLYSLMGCCYLKLDQPDKAREVVKKACGYGREVLAVDSTGQTHVSLINSYARIKDAYVRVKDFESARNVMEFKDSIVDLFERRHPNVSIWPIYHAYGHLDLAIKLWSLGQEDSAAVEYAIFEKSPSCNTTNGLIQSNDYLMNAGRWAEAADHYEALDDFIDKPYLEEISAYYFPKLRANYNAGRKDAALATAMQIAELFDSAYVWQKKSSMAEMATVFDTQGKEMQIARQQIELSRQRLWGTGIALALLLVFFIVYTEYRRRVANRLGAAHAELQNAYNQLEETTAAKERIESELRIARDIQMSMVPGIFPERKGLDMYAEMIPAKEVGGDLYGYVYLPAPVERSPERTGDMLYICVGDVSGKGVPASLFMAQSARLFRTLAAEGMMPADIAFRMNNALSENNDRGMFVTMFIGLLHLETGRLDFCNCGHNAPVIDGQFLKMQYVNQPLGLWEDNPFEGESVADIRGKQLLIYTDGLNEAENARHELLGNARLLALMSGAAHLNSHQVINMLREAVDRHRAEAEPNDDLTLMCLALDKRTDSQLSKTI